MKEIATKIVAGASIVLGGLAVYGGIRTHETVQVVSATADRSVAELQIDDECLAVLQTKSNSNPYVYELAADKHCPDLTESQANEVGDQLSDVVYAENRRTAAIAFPGMIAVAGFSWVGLTVASNRSQRQDQAALAK